MALTPAEPSIIRDGTRLFIVLRNPPIELYRQLVEYPTSRVLFSVEKLGWFRRSFALVCIRCFASSALTLAKPMGARRS